MVKKLTPHTLTFGFAVITMSETKQPTDMDENFSVYSGNENEDEQSSFRESVEGLLCYEEIKELYKNTLTNVIGLNHNVNSRFEKVTQYMKQNTQNIKQLVAQQAQQQRLQEENEKLRKSHADAINSLLDLLLLVFLLLIGLNIILWGVMC
jgi:hypothetical protein